MLLQNITTNKTIVQISVPQISHVINLLNLHLCTQIPTIEILVCNIDLVLESNGNTQ